MISLGDFYINCGVKNVYFIDVRMIGVCNFSSFLFQKFKPLNTPVMKQADETENAKNESSEEMAKPSRGQKISNFFKNLGRKKDGEADNEANSPKKKKVTFFGKNKKEEEEEDDNEEKGGDENKDNAAAKGGDEVPVQNGDDDATSVTSATSDASDDNDDKSDDKDDSVKKKSDADDEEVKGLLGY